MRCKQVQLDLDESKSAELSPALREHLASCKDCQLFLREWQRIAAGFGVLAGDPMPEASPGFAARLTRRLEEFADSRRSWRDYAESVGRRFVYAAFVLTALYILALLLPASGPLRGPATADPYLARTESVAPENDPIFGTDLQDLDQAPPTEPGQDSSQPPETKTKNPERSGRTGQQ